MPLRKGGNKEDGGGGGVGVSNCQSQFDFSVAYYSEKNVGAAGAKKAC